MGKNQYVVPREGGWAVRGEGNTRDTKRFNSQRDAVEFARKIARNHATEVVIHGRDGMIRDRISYGNDPYPPNDMVVDRRRAPRLREKSAAQRSSPQVSLQKMLETYQLRAAQTDPLEALLGMFDDDITDLSSMAKEDVLEAYRKKYGDSR